MAVLFSELGEDIPLAVLFEDEHVIAVDKPAGLVVHPTPDHPSGTLLHALLHRNKDEFPALGERRPHFVHRLDSGTSGVLLVAKTQPAMRALGARFEAHDLDRRYLALVVDDAGDLPPQGRFDTRHGRSARDRRRFTCRDDLILGPLDQAPRAITNFRLRERFTGAALVEATLETGRTHQIRVHFGEHGHGVLGDRFYGGRPRQPLARGVAARLGRPALHAYLLEIAHPVSGAPLRLEAPLPEDLARALASFRAAR